MLKNRLENENICLLRCLNIYQKPYNYIFNSISRLKTEDFNQGPKRSYHLIIKINLHYDFFNQNGLVDEFVQTLISADENHSIIGFFQRKLKI